MLANWQRHLQLPVQAEPEYRAESEPGSSLSSTGFALVISRPGDERGDVWQSDGAPDINRPMAGTTPYADWFASLEE